VWCLHVCGGVGGRVGVGVVWGGVCGGGGKWGHKEEREAKGGHRGGLWRQDAR
jgi:hypothetical protein